MITKQDCKFDCTIDLPDGRSIKVEYPYDMDHGAPWDEMDGIGIVRPAPNYFNRDEIESDGSRVIHSRSDAWIYDWPATREKAEKEGWGPDIETAMEADYDFVRGYLTEQWSYIGVCVTLLDEDGAEISSESVWGVESIGDYYAEKAASFANWLIAADDKERAESEYWKDREVMTV